MKKKDLQYYLKLPYTFQLIREWDGTWFIDIKELPGCMSDGETVEEAMKNIKDAMSGWIEVRMEHGLSVPEPTENMR